MNPLESLSLFIDTVQSLVAKVNTRDNLHLRPDWARQAVAERLAGGLRLLRAFLRRLIILMALELEWTLVDKRGEMKRPHGRKKAKSPSAGFSIRGLDPPKPSPWLNAHGPQFKPVVKNGRCDRVDVDMTNLYAQLDFLAGVAANPMAKAKRLAFHLARTYPYMITPPEGPKRIAGRWGTEVSACYDVMHYNIMTQSRNRPPPLPPPRSHCWPMISIIW